jgi:photosystem II stability/assembly factor-like uncharacterized protein
MRLVYFMHDFTFRTGIMKVALLACLALLLPAYHATAQWQWLNPLPEGNAYSAACAHGTSHLWVTGANGSVLRSTSGGDAWEAKPSILRTTPFIGLGIVFTDTWTGLVAMNNGALQRSTDGGDSWLLLPSSDMSIQKLRLAADASVWGTGGLGTIARSTNCGLTWTRFPSGITTVIFDVDVAAADNIVAVCGRGIVLRSNDAGASWTSSVPGLGTDIISVDFISASEGFAVQEPKTLLRTTDGGATWSDTTFTLNALTQVRFASTSTGWLVSTSRGIVHRTTDGGRSWQAVTVDPTLRYSFQCVLPVDEQTALVTGEGGALFLTTDRGATWSQRGAAVTRAHMHAISGLSESDAWVFGERSALHTTDRGQTWAGSDTLPLPGFRTGYGLGPAHILGGGAQGQLYASIDAGAHWTAQTLSAAGQIEQFIFPDALHGFVCGAHGTLARTSDGGASWQELTAGVTHDFTGIHAVDAQHAWTVGRGGRMYRTIDAGGTWQELSTGTTSDLFAVHFLNATDGWIGGQRTLMRTTDAGDTWQNAPQPGGLDVVYQIAYSDTSHGVVMLSRSIARTRDGGASYYRTDYPAIELAAVSPVSDGHIWAAASFGGILRYTPAAAVLLQPSSLDFGSVAVGKVRELPLTVENRGEADLVMTNVATLGAGFQFAGGSLAPLAPGASRQITLAFAPQDTGAVRGVGTIISNARLGVPTVDLRGLGIPRGTPALSHDPDTLDFGTLRLGTWSRAGVRISNGSAQPLLINSERLSGGDSAMFQIARESSYFLASGASDSVHLAFVPLNYGAFHTWLLVASNDLVEPEYRIPVRGRAVTPIIAAFPNPLEFGYVLIGASKPGQCAIHNTGTAPLAISSWILSGPDAAEFTLTNPGPGGIAPGDSLAVHIDFLPQSYGAKHAELLVASDDLVQPTFRIAINGNATTLGMERPVAPQVIHLSAAYPHPCSIARDGEAHFSVSLAQRGHVSLQLYDALGREAGPAVQADLSGGEHEMRYPVRALIPGTYIARLHTGGDPGESAVLRIIVVR